MNTKHIQIPTPALTVLNFSGGQQSSAILWMILRGELVPPKPFIVLNADPGMENSETYQYVKRMQRLCEDAKILFVTVPGPNLYLDLLQAKSLGKTRLDFPPYWTKDKETGKRGRLRQKCTSAYKIAPMDRELRRELRRLYGISLIGRMPSKIKVVKYIGFSVDEQHRVSESKQDYIKFEYPLIDLGMTKADVIAYFERIGEKSPARSVCNACFANSVSHFREMKKDRPQDFAQAVAIDLEVRDLSQFGVRETVFVCSACIPLAELDAAENSGLEEEEYSCDSGYCFV